MTFDPQEKPYLWLGPYYEIRQLVWMARVASGNSTDVPGFAIKNACLESFLIHARALDDFWGEKTKYKDDLLATDFGDSASAHLVDGETRERIDKDLCHVTTESAKRSQEGDKTWDLRCFKDLLKACLRFAEHARSQDPADPLDHDWAGLAESLKQLVAGIEVKQ